MTPTDRQRAERAYRRFRFESSGLESQCFIEVVTDLLTAYRSEQVAELVKACRDLETARDNLRDLSGPVHRVICALAPFQPTEGSGE